MSIFCEIRIVVVYINHFMEIFHKNASFSRRFDTRSMCLINWHIVNWSNENSLYFVARHLTQTYALDVYSCCLVWKIVKIKCDTLHFVHDILMLFFASLVIPFCLSLFSTSYRTHDSLADVFVGFYCRNNLHSLYLMWCYQIS